MQPERESWVRLVIDSWLHQQEEVRRHECKKALWGSRSRKSLRISRADRGDNVDFDIWGVQTGGLSSPAYLLNKCQARHHARGGGSKVGACAERETERL